VLPVPQDPAAPLVPLVTRDAPEPLDERGQQALEVPLEPLVTPVHPDLPAELVQPDKLVHVGLWEKLDLLDQLDLLVQLGLLETLGLVETPGLLVPLASPERLAQPVDRAHPVHKVLPGQQDLLARLELRVF